MQLRTLFICFVCQLTLAGCASPPPVAMTKSFWQDTTARIAIATTALPAPGHAVDTPPQYGGLANEVLGRSMATPYTERLKREDFSNVYTIVEKLDRTLKAKGFAPMPLRERLKLDEFTLRATRDDEYAERDFSTLATRLNADYLLLIDFQGIGTQRPQLIVPTGAPSGAFQARGQLVALKAGRVLWRKAVHVQRAIAEPWDQPPDYPNLVAAVHAAADAAVNQLYLDFSWLAK